MGQAKKRGTFEERSQQAIARRAEEIRKADEEEDRRYAERQAAEKAKWDAMTEEEQHAAKTRAARNHRGSLPIGAMAILPMLMLAGIGGMGSPIPGRRRR
jgi:hypothetical protein